MTPCLRQAGFKLQIVLPVLESVGFLLNFGFRFRSSSDLIYGAIFTAHITGTPQLCPAIPGVKGNDTPRSWRMLLGLPFFPASLRSDALRVMWFGAVICIMALLSPKPVCSQWGPLDWLRCCHSPFSKARLNPSSQSSLDTAEL